MAKLLDQYGEPVELGALSEEFAPALAYGARSVWHKSVESGLTPYTLATILKNADEGQPDQFYALARDMEKRDLHYRSVLNTRKLAVTSIEPIVVAASPSDQDEMIAQAVREDIMEHPSFIDDCVSDLLDALGKGLSIVELQWKKDADRWRFERFDWRDPRFFLIDKIDGRTLRRKDSFDSRIGTDLPPFKYAIHRPKLMSGLPVECGLARLSAWAFLFKSFTLKDWMAFLEVFGMPLRVGKYGASASTEEKSVLLRAVRDLSSDAAAIIPSSMEIDFIEARGGSGNAVFGAKADYLDRQLSKGVLGQTMTTDDGSSQAQANLHENVRHDIARQDVRQMAVTLNRDIVRPYIDLNFGVQKAYPTIIFPITENEDIQTLVSAVHDLVPYGLEISMSEIRERIGFGEPEEGDVLLSAPQSNLFPDRINKTLSNESKKARQLFPDDQNTMLARHQNEKDEDLFNEIIGDALSMWEEDLTPMLEPIEDLFDRAKNYDDLFKGLETIGEKMDLRPLTDRLAGLFMKAHGLGNTKGHNNKRVKK